MFCERVHFESKVKGNTIFGERVHLRELGGEKVGGLGASQNPSRAYLDKGCGLKCLQRPGRLPKWGV